MLDRAHTLGGRIRRSGLGLHGGRPNHIELHPAPPGTGRCFRLRGGLHLPATAGHVSATNRGVVLSGRAGTVRTPEHLLAALYALQVDDVWIDLDGEEVPILDGSSRPWVEAILEAGRAPLDAPPPRLEVLAPIEMTLGPAWGRISPGSGAGLSLTVEVDFSARGGPVGTWEGEATEVFSAELAGARTFGFAGEADRLRASGLALGATPDNVVVLGGPGLPELRWPDEPVRHKALDAVGDLSLIGARLCARAQFTRAGHALHVALVQHLLRSPTVWRRL